MQRAVALVLAGGRIQGYGVLTLNRTKAALPFAGFYRIVDFALSSLSRSGIGRVGLICQYLPASLIEHVGGGEAWGLNGFGCEVRLMPPFVGVGKIEWFRGTADAIYQNMNFIQDWDPSYVIVCSAEHVFSLDFSEVVSFHETSGADLTVLEKQLPREQQSKRFGYVVVGDDGRVAQFLEKPDEPPSDRVSIGIFVFNKEVLVRQLERLDRGEKCFNLSRDIIPSMVDDHRVVAYSFPGYWNYLETIEDYYRASMSLLDETPAIDLKGWEVLTNLSDRGLGRRPSAYAGPAARIEDALISPGCHIEGAVERSILSPGVVVERDAVVSDSILMHDVRVERGARIHQVVSDKDVVFGAGSEVGWGRPRASDRPLNLTLIGKGFVVTPQALGQWKAGPATRANPIEREAT
jgi:glucose-1-phosphate adenylyltransferase